MISYGDNKDVEYINSKLEDAALELTDHSNELMLPIDFEYSKGKIFIISISRYFPEELRKALASLSRETNDKEKKDFYERRSDVLAIISTKVFYEEDVDKNNVNNYVNRFVIQYKEILDKVATAYTDIKN